MAAGVLLLLLHWPAASRCSTAGPVAAQPCRPVPARPVLLAAAAAAWLQRCGRAVSTEPWQTGNHKAPCYDHLLHLHGNARPGSPAGSL
jgi:hypothetical protein